MVRCMVVEDPDPAEVEPEPRLEEGPIRSREWMSADLVPLIALTLERGRSRSGEPRVCQLHHLASDVICFLLVYVSRLINCQFFLDRCSSGRMAGTKG